MEFAPLLGSQNQCRDLLILEAVNLHKAGLTMSPKKTSKLLCSLRSRDDMSVIITFRRYQVYHNYKFDYYKYDRSHNEAQPEINTAGLQAGVKCVKLLSKTTGIDLCFAQIGSSLPRQTKGTQKGGREERS